MFKPCLLATVLVSLASVQPLGQSASDTLPAHVVQRAIDAFKCTDRDATFAVYDTAFAHETLGDGKGAERVRRADWVRQMESDTSSLNVMNNWRITHIERGGSAHWVYDIWTMRGPKDQTTKHVDLLDVRHGKVVREIEG